MAEKDADGSFDIQATLKTLKRHHASGNGEALFEELLRPWPGMSADMRLAVGELIAEMMRNGKVPLFFKTLEFDDETESVRFEFPDWFHVANQAFAQRYPNSIEADLRFQKTMAVLQYRLMAVQELELPEVGGEALMAALKDWLPDGPAIFSTRIH